MPAPENTNYLNIVCLDVPYPADYGGAMEEFYKLKELHALGVKVILHCFVYGDRERQKELEKYCSHIFYYERKKNFRNIFSFLPFIVKTRMHKELLKNLVSNKYPILFDSTHSTGFLAHPTLKSIKKVVRLHNIEWIYYNTLFRSALTLWHKLFYYSEYKKLRMYDNELKHADVLLCLSQTDYEYYSEKFREKQVELVYVFHENDEIKSKAGKGDYLLYHGNLSVLDNYMAVIDLLNNELKDNRYPIVLAGKNPDSWLIDFVKKRADVQLIANPSNSELDKLIMNAQICLAIANNPSGIKLKLINSIYRGRFIFSNESAFEGSGLDECVVNISDHRNDMGSILKEYMEKEFTEEDIEKRRAIIDLNYNNPRNAEKIAEVIFSAPIP